MLAQPSMAVVTEKKKSSIEVDVKQAGSKRQEPEKTYEVKETPAPSAVHEQEQPIKQAAPQPAVFPKTISIKEGSTSKQPQSLSPEKVSSALLEASGLGEILSGTGKPPLEHLWGAFAERLFKQGKMALHSTFTKRKPEFTDEQTILFFVDNASLEKDFNQVKPDLMEHLRKSMGNPLLSLNIEVAKDEHKSDKPYSAQDKFKWLAERNPKLNEMKKLFDLDVD